MILSLSIPLAIPATLKPDNCASFDGVTDTPQGLPSLGWYIISYREDNRADPHTQADARGNEVDEDEVN